MVDPTPHPSQDSLPFGKRTSTPSDAHDPNKKVNHAPDITELVSVEPWHHTPLSIVVIGASGDLAKKKTYPSFLRLFITDLLADDFVIYGYARSNLTDDEFRAQIRPFLRASSKCSDDEIELFLKRCFYKKGRSYDDATAFGEMNVELVDFEAGVVNNGSSKVRNKEAVDDVDDSQNATTYSNNNKKKSQPSSSQSAQSSPPLLLESNRLFYFAIPANVFASAASAIKANCLSRPPSFSNGWTRIIIEKPFGHDSESCEELSQSLSHEFDESSLYRIDHYLGKEIVQNLMVMRFANVWFERLWNRTDVAAVQFTFKEPFGTEGRGGYFDKYGIIRDILQNHLLQVLTLVAMEPPLKVEGHEAGDQIRDSKVNVLRAMPIIKIEDCILGQYEGYTDDPTVPNDSVTPTFACIRCFVNTPRWAGVPFILKAGKALDERKAEVRIQFRDAPAASFMFDSPCPRNELVMRLQPREAIYMKTNVKTPGFASAPIQSELEVDYDTRFNSQANPDAYTRLILDVLRGKTAGFVRRDELVESWKIFTPLLHTIERLRVKPIAYKQGSRGPDECDRRIEEWGYIRNMDYVYYEGRVVPKSKI